MSATPVACSANLARRACNAAQKKHDFFKLVHETDANLFKSIDYRL